MNIEIILAYLVVSVVIVFVVIPMVGSGFGGRFTSYKEDFILGLCVTGVIAGVSFAVMSVIWAVGVITK